MFETKQNKGKYSPSQPHGNTRQMQVKSLQKSNAETYSSNHSFGNYYLSGIHDKGKNASVTSCGHSFAPEGYCPFGGACHACPVQFQTKLQINKPGDKYEREADAMAEKVMKTTEPTVQKKSCSSYNDVDGNKTIQAKHQSPASSAPTTALNLNKTGVFGGSGQKMPGATKSFMESRFGTDFSAVRVHNSPRAENMNKQLNSKAFTVGNDIYFSQGHFQPGSNSGQKLIAHELTHVIQQRGTGQRIQRWGGAEHKEATLLASNVILEDDVKPIANNKSEFINTLLPYSVSTDFKARRILWTGPQFLSGAIKGEGPDHGEDGNYSKPLKDKNKAMSENVARQEQYVNESAGFFSKLLNGLNKGKKASRVEGNRSDGWDILAMPGFGAIGGAIGGTLMGYGLAKMVSDSVGGGFWGGLLGTLTGLATVPLGLALGTAIGATGAIGIFSTLKSRSPRNAKEAIIASLGDACHVAQDRGSHWEGVKGFGHTDPRTKDGWNPDNKSDNPGNPGDFGGFTVAVKNTREVFKSWVQKIRLLKKKLLKKPSSKPMQQQVPMQQQKSA